MPNIESNFNEEILSLILSGDEGIVSIADFDPASNDHQYIRISVHDEDGEFLESFDSRDASSFYWNINFNSDNEINNFFIKPNDILAEHGYEQGNYTLRIDFLSDYRLEVEESIDYSDMFRVKDISASRKEIRLFFRDSTNDIVILDDNEYNFTQPNFTNILGDPASTTENPYLYDWALLLSEGRNISIINYLFDLTTYADPTLILRFSEPIPSDITELASVRISKEVLQTQTETIFFVTDQVSEEALGFGLESSYVPDIGGTDDVEYNINTTDTAQNFDMLTGSLSDSSLTNFLLSESYENLNIDYNEFNNHAFFGSATERLENFRYKAKQIEGHLNKISASLSLVGTASVESRRRDLFSKINTITNNFTPYERFLYYDNQTQTTSSAPGLGRNLASLNPFQTSSIAGGASAENVTVQYGTEGFDVVHKLTNASVSGNVNVFNNKYFAERKPFFNYSGSVYLSFLLRADSELTSSTPSLGFNWTNQNIVQNPMATPKEALGSGSLLTGNITSSNYVRFILESSQSYWRPARLPNVSNELQIYGAGGSGEGLGTFSTNNSDTYEILSGSSVASASDSASANAYPIKAFDQYSNLGTSFPTSGSDVSAGFPFTGSILPSGDLFHLYWTYTDAEKTATFTDVKITTKDPSDALPFSFMYKTGSSAWNDWYNGMHSSASAYDESNINSLQNNLPISIKEDSDSYDLKKFVNLIGEHFDVIRNYIDNYLNIHKRNYSNKDSIPRNLMPIIAKNLGWDLISPFTGSMAEYFGTSEHDIHVGGGSVETVTNNTWLKILNNLVHIYKAKGTRGAVRSLLNVYGYAPDLLNIQEFGGSAEEHNPTIIKDDASELKKGLGGAADNVSFIHFKDQLYSYMFGEQNRLIKSDWGINSVSSPETVEFVIKPSFSTKDQDVIQSSGSGTEKLWDLRLVSSASNATIGKLEFRLNNSRSGSSAIANNAVSMSTDYLNLKTGGHLWNVMLQRMTSSITGTGTQEYRLFTGKQDNDKISVLSAVSMSVSGGTTRDSNFNANENWAGTGSRHYLSASNLYIGQTYTGSMSEFRAWSVPLSASKFKQHILNKKSTVGHSFSSSMDDIYYRYSLGENWKSGSDDPQFKDANPKNVKDYSINLNTDIFTGSLVVYDRTEIDIYKLSLRSGGTAQPNDNKIIINPTTTLIGDLNSETSNIKSLYDTEDENKRKISNNIQIIRSPQKILNEFIIDNLSDFNISKFFADPDDLYKSQYKDLDDFRDKLFNHFNVSIDINIWIDAQTKIFNRALIDSINKLLPAKATSNKIGILLEPSILEKNKIEYKKSEILFGTDIGDVDGDIDMSLPNLDDSLFDYASSGNYNVINNITQSGAFEKNHIGLYNIPDNISKAGAYEKSHLGLYNVKDDVTEGGFYEKSHLGTYYIQENILKVGLYDKTNIANYDVHATIKKEGLYNKINIANYNIQDNILKEGLYNKINIANYNVHSNISKEGLYNKINKAKYEVKLILSGSKKLDLFEATTFNLDDDITQKGSYEKSYDGTEHYISSQSVASFKDYDKLWGTSSNDLHFINPAYSASSGDSEADRWNNVGYYENRFVFKSIGDVERISGSRNENESGFFVDFNNSNYFLNREVRDKGKGFTYKSYIGVGGNSEGPQDGRPVGKTWYYATASDGELIYPSNHWIKFSEDPFRINLTNGTQTTTMGRKYHTTTIEDTSTSASYVTDVDRQDEIIIRRGIVSSKHGGKIDRS